MHVNVYVYTFAAASAATMRWPIFTTITKMLYHSNSFLANLLMKSTHVGISWITQAMVIGAMAPLRAWIWYLMRRNTSIVYIKKQSKLKRKSQTLKILMFFLYFSYFHAHHPLGDQFLCVSLRLKQGECRAPHHEINVGQDALNVHV